MSERRPAVPGSAAASRCRSIRAGGLALCLTLVPSILALAPPPASAAPRSYSKTMQFTGRLRGGFRLCQPWPFTHLTGTSVDFYSAQICGPGGGGPRCASISDYVRTVSSGFVLLSIRQVASSPVPWIVTMLQHSTFNVLGGAGGNPDDPNTYFDRFSPQDWTLPNNWLLATAK